MSGLTKSVVAMLIVAGGGLLLILRKRRRKPRQKTRMARFTVFYKPNIVED